MTYFGRSLIRRQHHLAAQPGTSPAEPDNEAIFLTRTHQITLPVGAGEGYFSADGSAGFQSERT